LSSLSSENERTFSGTRLIISDNRIRVGPDVVEAIECLHHWKKGTVRESWTPDWSEEAYTQVVCGVYTRQSSMRGSKKLYV